MSLGMGNESWAGFSEESTWGTEGTPRTKFLPLLRGGDGLGVSEDPIISDRMAVGVKASTDFNLGPISVNGDIEVEVYPEGIEMLLDHAMGAVATTQPDVTNDPTVYQHVFSLSDALQDGKGLSVEIDRGAAVFVYTGCKVDSMRLSARLNEYLKARFSLVGKDQVIEASPSTPTFPAMNPYVFTEGVFKWGVTTVGISNATIELRNNLDSDRRTTVSGRNILEPVRGRKREVTFECEVEFDSTALVVDFRAATSRALQLKYTGDVIAAGSYSQIFQIDMAVAKITEAMPQARDEGRIVYTVRGTAFIETANEMTITVINTVTSV